MATRKAKPKAKCKAAAARKPASKTAAAKKASAKSAAPNRAAPNRAAPKVKAPKVAAPKIALPKLLPKWSSAQKSEFAAIQMRAKALGAGLTRADFDTDGNPLPGGPWAALLADLDAWARKYNVTLTRQEHDHAPAAGGAAAAGAAGAEATPLIFRGECPGSFTKVEKRKFADFTQVHTTSCTLRRQTWLGRCLYDCTEDYDYV